MRRSSFERYGEDPLFARLVDMIYSLLCSGDFTPSEIREAAMVAATKQEMLAVRHISLTEEEFERLRPDLKKLR